MESVLASIPSQQPVASSFQLSRTKNHGVLVRKKCRGAVAALGLHSRFLGGFSALINPKGSHAEAAAQRAPQWSTASVVLPFSDFSADRRVMPRSAEVIGKFFIILQMVVLYRRLVTF